MQEIYQGELWGSNLWKRMGKKKKSRIGQNEMLNCNVASVEVTDDSAESCKERLLFKSSLLWGQMAGPLKF